MPRWLAHALVVVGWLLTPLWAWGASFCGTWLGARLTASWTDPVAMLGTTIVAGAGASLAALWLWVRVMRRCPHWLARRMAPRGKRDPEATRAG